MIAVENLHKSFGPKQVLRGVSFRIEAGETVAIIGRSGTGKSVLLKLIVGLLQPDQGTVTLDGKRVDQMSEKELYEMRRTIGYVFQGAALFDSLTVAQNIVLGLHEHGERNQQLLDSEIHRNLLNVGLLPDPERMSPAAFNEAYQIIANKNRRSFPAGCESGWGWRAPLLASPATSFTTSQPRAWTRSPASRLTTLSATLPPSWTSPRC
ncbi:MAG: ABC transport system ATP-binding protein [Chlorobi bacterium OLB7]|nr:MAG: ABC transport system ATP-binding protein [Chlorobi bacterium OLB7]